MSLFPAYGQEAAVAIPREAESDVRRADGSPREAAVAARWGDTSPGAAAAVAARWGDTSPDAAVAMETEASLLASSDSEPEPTPAPAAREPELDYYVDRRFDGGNLRVSTIYYPGRPQYNSPEFHHALGLVRGPRRKKRVRRYWEAGGGGGGGGRGGGGEGPQGEGEGERGAALRRALVERPRDVELWLQYIDYQEWVHGPEAGLAAAEAGAARAPRAAGLRARRHALLQRTLSAQDYVTRLRDELTQEKDPPVTTELWMRLLEALARAPAAGVSGAQAAAAAALRACRRLPAAYPNLLYAYGSILRAAGLWETLVLLLELVLAAASPAAFPPPRDSKAEQEAEERLQDYEDKVVNSGLPSGAVWARVERARGAAHWRPARPGAAADADAAADPQRAPAVADVADFVLPVTDPSASFLLLVNALRLAKVPLLPGAQYVYEAAGAGADEWDCGEALLSLVRAARRTPHAAPAPARELVRLAVDPPHYFSPDHGYRGWVEALWEAALAAAGAEAVVALLCWRMRWLHTQLLLLPESPESASEARWIRDAAQATLKRWGGSHALAYAQFARVAHAAARRGGGGGRDAGLRAATVALRAALQDPSVPIHYLLYIARIVNEVSGAVGALSEPGARALACAVLRRPLPSEPTDAGLLRDARDECFRRCLELEQEMESEESGASSSGLGCGARLLRALLPREAEWGVARALLAEPRQRHELLQSLLASSTGVGRAGRWREQQAAALALRVRGGDAAARELAQRYPNNALLALASSGAAPWAWATGAVTASPTLLLGAAWPSLLGALAGQPARAGALARRLRRAGAEGAAAVWALRLEAEARAPAPRLEHVAHAAMDVLPHHKWLTVRCAALGAAGGGGALPDVLLERALRLHALPDELRALPDELRALPDVLHELPDELRALPDELRALAPDRDHPPDRDDL